MRKCVFFDRDGIVNSPPKEGDYVRSVEEFFIMPEFLDALRVSTEYGYDAIIVTNQQGIGKSLYSEETLGNIHDKLLRDVEASDLKVLAIYHCPHLADEDCMCRKPKPGMILQAAKDWDVDLSASWVVGDSFRDVDAGVAAGCKTVLVAPHAYERATVCIDRIEKLPMVLADILRQQI